MTLHGDTVSAATESLGATFRKFGIETGSGDIAEWLLSHGWKFDGWVDTRYTAIVDKMAQRSAVTIEEAALLMEVVEAARATLTEPPDGMTTGGLARALAELDAPLAQVED